MIIAIMPLHILEAAVWICVCARWEMRRSFQTMSMCLYTRAVLGGLQHYLFCIGISWGCVEKRSVSLFNASISQMSKNKINSSIYFQLCKLKHCLMAVFTQCETWSSIWWHCSPLGVPCPYVCLHCKKPTVTFVVINWYHFTSNWL